MDTATIVDEISPAQVPYGSYKGARLSLKYVEAQSTDTGNVLNLTLGGKQIKGLRVYAKNSGAGSTAALRGDLICVDTAGGTYWLRGDSPRSWR